MADLISNLDKINDIEVAADAPISESLFRKFGENVNGLIDLAGTFVNTQSFTANGFFNVPEGITRVFVEVQGGGGSGAEGEGTGGAGGGAGARSVGLVGVTPLDSIAVTIGAGGSGVRKAGSEKAWGNNGGASSFGGLLAARGGFGGHGGKDNAVGVGDIFGANFGGGQLNAAGFDFSFGTPVFGTLKKFFERTAGVAAGGNAAVTADTVAQTGENSVRFSGGDVGDVTTGFGFDTRAAGAGGGASWYAAGGKGGANSVGGSGGGVGFAGSLGSGGGGGGYTGSDKISGAGGSGIVIVYW